MCIRDSYSIDYIVKDQLDTNLEDIIEMSEEQASYILNSCAKLLLYVAKQKYQKFKEFQVATYHINLNLEKKEIIWKCLQENNEAIRQHLLKLEVDLIPRYKKLEWRFDLQIASRAKDEELKPKIFMKFHTENNEEKKQQVLIESDYANLSNLHSELKNILDLHELSKQKKIREIFH
eukprot:TRINITY_DN17152_c0_g1_i2.p1 TRINITY_DN17152_c0_g1~~TRINITY_DN17152_c0_g1_i2.p1  ORF type:complete len:177 (+),score=39.59 TRINITY_DN17152_c0_g1_i2:86-616(+)